MVQAGLLQAPLQW